MEGIAQKDDPTVTMTGRANKLSKIFIFCDQNARRIKGQLNNRRVGRTLIDICNGCDIMATRPQYPDHASVATLISQKQHYVISSLVSGGCED